MIRYPKTGRTHQIRVHLKSIGHPIENDKIYRTIYQVEKDIAEGKEVPPKPKEIKLHQNIPYSFNEEKRVIPEICGDDFEEIYLHAYKYKFGKYSFKTKYPSWAIQTEIKPTVSESKPQEKKEDENSEHSAKKAKSENPTQ